MCMCVLNNLSTLALLAVIQVSQRGVKGRWRGNWEGRHPQGTRATWTWLSTPRFPRGGDPPGAYSLCGACFILDPLTSNSWLEGCSCKMTPLTGKTHFEMLYQHFKVKILAFFLDKQGTAIVNNESLRTSTMPCPASHLYSPLGHHLASSLLS
jgi:hypothetical protein